MRKKYKVLLTLITLILFLIILLGVFYFVFYKKEYNDGQIKLTEYLSINYTGSSKLKIKGSHTTKITIINHSEEDTRYFIEFNNPENVKGVKFKLVGNNDINISDKVNSYNTIISSYITIKAGEIHDYTLTFNGKEKQKYSIDVNINDESVQTSFFADVILKNNKVNDKTKTTVGSQIATEDEGLIKSSDDYGTTYYFRGNVKNNNVLINNLKFKIVRINGDGSVKLVLNEKITDLKKYYYEISNAQFANSDINIYLKSWLSINLADHLSEIANSKFCEDTTVSNNKYISLNRISIDKNPTFMCLGDKISSKIGLLTADEVLYAGGSVSENNTSYYLYNEAFTTSSYLLTPAQFKENAYYPFVLTKEGKIESNTIGTTLLEVRPVINIQKTVMVTGSGTSEDPYVLTDK